MGDRIWQVVCLKGTPHNKNLGDNQTPTILLRSIYRVLSLSHHYSSFLVDGVAFAIISHCCLLLKIPCNCRHAMWPIQKKYIFFYCYYLLNVTLQEKSVPTEQVLHTKPIKNKRLSLIWLPCFIIPCIYFLGGSWINYWVETGSIMILPTYCHKHITYRITSSIVPITTTCLHASPLSPEAFLPQHLKKFMQWYPTIYFFLRSKYQSSVHKFLQEKIH